MSNDDISPVLRRWSAGIERGLPSEMLDVNDEHGARWAAQQLPGTRLRRMDRDRAKIALGFMWSCLGGTRVPHWVPEHAHWMWGSMLRDPSPEAVQSLLSFLPDGPARSAVEQVSRILQQEEIWLAPYADDEESSLYQWSALSAGFAAEASGDPDGFWRLADPARVLEEMVHIDDSANVLPPSPLVTSRELSSRQVQPEQQSNG